MVHQELVEYISTAKNGGISEPQIIQTLAGVGWAMPDIEEAMGVIKGTRQSTDSSFQSVIQQAERQEKPNTSPNAPQLQASLQENKSATTTPPIVTAAASLPPTQNTGSKKSLFLKIAAGTVMLLIAGTGLAYYKGLIGSRNAITYTEGSILLSASQAIGNMGSAKYKISFHVATEPRDENFKPFAPTPPTDEELAPYKRDQDRFKLLENVRNTFRINSGISSTKYQFPKTLASVNITAKDPLGSPYTYVQIDGGKDFELRIAFETPEAIRVLKQELPKMFSSPVIVETSSIKPLIENYVVTFDQKSIRSYYYFSGHPDTFTFVDAFANSDDLLSFLPSTLDITVSVSGIMNKKGGDTRDTYLQGTADIDLGDFIANADVEFIKKADTYFVRVNKMPTFFFFDFSAIKKQWIQIDSSAETNGLIDPQTIQDSLTSELGFFGMSGPASGTQSSEAAKKNVKEGALLILSVGEKSGFINVGNPSSETHNGEAALRYPIRFEKTKLKTFYVDLVKAFEDRFGKDSPIYYDEYIAKQLEYKSVGELIDYINSSSALTMWVAEKTGYPIAFEYTIHVAPRSTTGSAAKKQFQTTIAIALSDINKSNTVDAPKDAISTEDAVILMSGISKEAYRFEQQTNTVSSIKSALSTYHGITGTYPNTLAELVQTREEIKKVHPNSSQKPNTNSPDFYYTNKKLLEKIPTDTYTKKAFSYAKNGNDYTLAYTIMLPPYERGMQATYSLTQNDYSKKTITLKYVSGTNTATKNIDSREATLANSQDFDKDGVSDAFEAYMGTDKNKKDTDNDGVDDKSEINNRSNPLGPGLLEYPKSQGGGLFF